MVQAISLFTLGNCRDFSVATNKLVVYVVQSTQVGKASEHNLGNIPLDILTYLSRYFEYSNKSGTLEKNLNSAHVLMAGPVDVLGDGERVVNTPLPVSYSISMSQIMWAYVLSLQFQLYGRLGLVTIAGTFPQGTYLLLPFSPQAQVPE